MLQQIYIAAIATILSSPRAICWLINRMSERKFLLRADKEVRDSYLQLRKVSGNDKLPIVRKLTKHKEEMKKIA